MSPIHPWRVVLALALCAGCAADEMSSAAGGAPAADLDPSPDGWVSPADGTVLDIPEWAGPEGDTAFMSVPEPTDVLVAGAATRSLRFPLGVATVGYAPGIGAPSPWAAMYPGTDSQHTALHVKVLVMRNGGNALVIARTDTIGVWQDMVRDVAARLRLMGRGDLAEGLIIGATHTHSSGGRVFDHMVGEIAVGEFLPGLYGRFLDAIVDAVLAADGSAIAAHFGHTTIQVPSLHKDRRCENPDLQDDSLGLMVLANTNGEVFATVLNYAMHGTVIGTDITALSSDAPGAMEHGIESRYHRPITALYLQSWAGDMAPRTPEGYEIEDGADLHEEYRQLDAMAAAAADVVLDALDSVVTGPDAPITVVTARFPLDGDLINPDGSFSEYKYGGIWCISGDDNCEEDAEPFGPESIACLPFDEDNTVTWGQISAARIGDLGLVTLPGEPCTSVGLALRDGALEATGLSQVLIVGYAQGYLSYLLHADDFYMGGYEAASVLMGPGFGDYLVQAGVGIARRLMEPDAELPFVPVDMGPAKLVFHAPLEHEQALEEPKIGSVVFAEDLVVAVSWTGGDPATDEPVVSLERRDGDLWLPVLHPSSLPVDSNGPEIVLSLAPTPGYAEDIHAASRVFTWTARMPTLFTVTPGWGQPEGELRFVVRGTMGGAYELAAEPFDPSAPPAPSDCSENPTCGCMVAECFGEPSPEEGLWEELLCAPAVFPQPDDPCLEHIQAAYTADGCGEVCPGFKLPGQEGICELPGCSALRDLLAMMGVDPCACL